jgi:uncharacterized membrane protein
MRSHTHPTPGRLEAFSDGVIAVIITIMVLELKTPHEPGLLGLLSVVPSIAVYALSFSFTGIYWVNHHHLVDRLKRVDHLILWSNLIFLFFLSLLPFFTNYLIDKGVQSFSVALYGVSMLVTGLSFTLLQKSIARNLRHAAPDEHEHDPEELAEHLAEQRKAKLSLAMYIAAVGLAYWRPWAALAVIALVTLLWIVPTIGVKPHHPHPLEPKEPN